jgi:hypothetical protein
MASKKCCLSKEELEEVHQLERIFGVVDLSNWTLTKDKEKVEK